MIVAVGTKNPAKIEGIRRAFTRYYPEPELRTVDTATFVRPQPLGLEQIAESAVIRARHALSKAGGDFGVGVEAGIFTMSGSYFDHQQAAIVDRLGRASLGHSSGFMLPAAPVERILREGKELEHYAVELTGIKEIGDKGGLIHYLTNGQVSRADLTEQCVVTALAPWLHREVYRT